MEHVFCGKGPSILFIPIGSIKKASSRVRVHWIKKYLKITVKVAKPLDAFPLFIFIIFNLNNEIYVFQKNTSRYHYLAVRLLKLLNKKTVFDIDDFPAPNNSEITLKNFKKMCSSVQIILAGSPNLVELCKKHNPSVYLLPSGIKLQNYFKKVIEPVDLVCIGWIGNGMHYANDLTSILKEPLQILAKTYQLKLKIIGTANNNVIIDAFSATEGLEFEHVANLDWSNAIVIDEAIDDFDIGVYPLIENNSNKYKCGFKALEYYAKGIPVVSSNVAMNKDIVLHEETGFIVNTTEEWISALEALIKDAQLRKRMGEAGHKHVKENYAIEKIAARFEEIVRND